MTQEMLDKLNTDTASGENKDTQVTETESAGKEDTLGLPSAVDQDKMAQFEAWQKQQQAEEARQAVLAPIGGVDGFNKAIEQIRSTGDIDFLKQIDTDLGNKDTMNAGVAKIQAYVSAMNKFKPAQETKEEPMFSSVLPKMGQSDATPTGAGAAKPEVTVSDKVTFTGIKDPDVADAVNKMKEQINTYNRQNPTSYKDQHLVGLKAMSEHLNPVIRQAESFGHYEKAQEALAVVAQTYSQLAKLSVQNDDKTLVDMFGNAKEIKFQADAIERTIQSDHTAELDYKRSMFSKFGVK